MITTAAADKLRSLLLMREAAIIIAIVCGAYVYISLGSYNTSDIDTTGQIANIGGALGSYLAHGFFFFFGSSAYLAVAVIICSIWLALGQIAQNRARYWAARSIAGLLLLLVCTSSMEALHFSGNEDLPYARSGGILGFSVAGQLFHLLGFYGTTLILSGCWLAGLSLFANFSWLEVCDLLGLAAELAFIRIIKPALLLLRQAFFIEVDQATQPAKPANASAPPPPPPAVAAAEAPTPAPIDPRKSTSSLFRKRKPLPPLTSEPSLPGKRISRKTSQPQQENAQTPRPAPQEPEASPAAADPVPGPRRRTSKPDMPAATLLSPITSNARRLSNDELQAMAESIRSKLEEFGVMAAVREILPGPVITRYEIEPATGVKGSQIVGLVRDLSRALGVASIRVLESIPGKTTMGLEVPNSQREMVSLQDVISSGEFGRSASPLSLALGKDIAGIPVVVDLERMPHLLAAGTTGSGKSVQINSIILSLLFKSSPDDVRLILVDPKVVEMGVYEGLPHLFSQVVTNMELVPAVLSWCVGEMERRYQLMAAHGVRNIAGLNAAAAKGIADPESGEPLAPLPRLVVIIDELADLMMVAGKKVEQQISRLAQKARAAGVHLILATQRPSVNVITGLIKANIPTRIAFQVASKIDSRTIIDQGGAESLLGRGDMLYLPGGAAEPRRIHGAYVSDEDVHKVVAHVKEQYDGSVYPQVDFQTQQPNQAAGGNGGAEEEDELYGEAVEVVRKNKRASISLVQRHLRIGYNRAARLVEMMESRGLVSAMDETGGRKLLS